MTSLEFKHILKHFANLGRNKTYQEESVFLMALRHTKPNFSMNDCITCGKEMNRQKGIPSVITGKIKSSLFHIFKMSFFLLP